MADAGGQRGARRGQPGGSAPAGPERAGVPPVVSRPARGTVPPAHAPPLPRPVPPPSGLSPRSPQGSGRTLEARLRRAWVTNPFVAYFQHRRRLYFYRQLHALVKAGVGMPIAFQQLAEAAPGSTGAAILRAADHVAQGASLGDALRLESGTFDDPMLELLSAGEQAGTLESALATIVEHLEQLQTLRRRVFLGALWPIYLVGAMTFVSPLLLLPAAIRRGVPPGDLTGIVIAGLARNVLIVGGTCLLLMLFPFAIAGLDLGRSWEKLKLSIPLLGSGTRNAFAARFLLALGFGVRAGTPFPRALRLAARASGSDYVESQVEPAIRRLERGGTFAQSIETIGLLRREEVGHLAIAERTGTLEGTLQVLAKEAQEAFIRAIRTQSVIALAVIAVVAVALIVKAIFGVLFGVFWEFQHLPID